MPLNRRRPSTRLVAVMNLLELFTITFGASLSQDRVSTDSPNVLQERCYQDLGCIRITDDWYHVLYRPVNLLPLPRISVNTTFYLYTRSNPLHPEIYTPEFSTVAPDYVTPPAPTIKQTPGSYVIFPKLPQVLEPKPDISTIPNAGSQPIQPSPPRVILPAPPRVVQSALPGRPILRPDTSQPDRNQQPIIPSIPSVKFNRTKRANGTPRFQNIGNSKNGSPLNIRQIPWTLFDPLRRTAVIIHGYIDSSEVPWAKSMVSALLLKGDFNVIAVDWRSGSRSLYEQSAANTRLVALETSQLLLTLMKEYSINPSTIHVIGHSLGAHTAGYVGSKIPGLGRITGLDPAEPYFQGMPPHVRLDPTDAQFVDVIHSDSSSILQLGYGMRQRCGHMDFYPNDGKLQPGCDITHYSLTVPMKALMHGLIEAGRELAACSHVRAVNYFTESILSKRCSFLGHVCSSYDSFIKGDCVGCGRNSSDCVPMGWNSINHYNPLSPPSVYYLMTKDTEPYCGHHYFVRLTLRDHYKANENVKGFLKLILFGERLDSGLIDITNGESREFKHGTSYEFMFTSRSRLEHLTSVKLMWEFDGTLGSFCIIWCNSQLYVQNMVVRDVDGDYHGSTSNKKMCSGRTAEEYTTIKSSSSSLFYLNPC